MTWAKKLLVAASALGAFTDPVLLRKGLDLILTDRVKIQDGFFIWSLATALGDKLYLDGARFTAGDLMMTTVLRILPELIVNQPLAAYVERCTSRPGFKRALDAQMGDFKQAA